MGSVLLELLMCMCCNSLFVLFLVVCPFSFDHCVVCSSIYGILSTPVVSANSPCTSITFSFWPIKVLIPN